MRSAVCALGKERATFSTAAGALPRRRSQRLSASFATSAPSTWRRRTASMMVRFGEYKPMLSSVSARRCSVRPTSNVARSNVRVTANWLEPGDQVPLAARQGDVGRAWDLVGQVMHRQRAEQADRRRRLAQADRRPRCTCVIELAGPQVVAGSDLSSSPASTIAYRRCLDSPSSGRAAWLTIGGSAVMSTARFASGRIIYIRRAPVNNLAETLWPALRPRPRVT